MRKRNRIGKLTAVAVGDEKEEPILSHDETAEKKDKKKKKSGKKMEGEGKKGGVANGEKKEPCDGRIRFSFKFPTPSIPVVNVVVTRKAPYLHREKPFVVPKEDVNYLLRTAKWQLGLVSYHERCLNAMQKLQWMQENRNSFVAILMANLLKGVPINASSTRTTDELNNQWSIVDEYVRGVDELKGRRNNKQLRGKALEFYDKIIELGWRLKKLKEQSDEIQYKLDQIADRFTSGVVWMPPEEEEEEEMEMKKKRKGKARIA
ncbi:hypothetical protein PFISCL1PPCAC_1157 [Pristionchus fissidentatus]|uniref:Uncharacterized protein n=1 Tax=Pristionchus fissidentatus TaxID=1538716 RepID=A0AAV5URQ8_9BILA|nr:hypothetical protein PFISCL1PPCAC_1157 [Pristionchus fissidentatus]